MKYNSTVKSNHIMKFAGKWMELEKKLFRMRSSTSRKRGFNDCILGNNGLKTGISNTIIEVKNQTSNENLGVNSP